MQVMTKSVVSVLASVLAGVLSCTPSQPGPNTPSLVVPGAAIAAPGAVARIAGCWRLQSLDWRAAFLADSTFIYLDTATVRGQPPQSAYAARLFFPSPSPETLEAGWAPFGPGDSLYITVGTSYHGVRLRLGRAGDSLTGMGRNWNDTFTDTQEGSVRGARTSCITRPPQN